MEVKQQNLTPTTDATVPTVPNSRSGIGTVHQDTLEPNLNQNFVTLPPRDSSPILSNKASSSHQPQPSKTPSLTPPLRPITSLPEKTKGPAPAPVNKQTLVEKLRASADMTLKRLAPVLLAPSGRPRVVIPDSVFKKGAEIHQDFIICYFNGKSPPFNQIQSVFNYMWGKGKQLEIHNNPLNRTVIVRIQSPYLRQKILEKNIWYVGESMFHTAQWNSNHSTATPPLKAIQIWAHLIGVPLDLRYDEGLSLVAGLVGEPKETDEFTKNMVSLTVSHVKVEVDLTLPLPSVVEFERESGEVVEVQVHYPWVPPTCSHCHELGHILRNCLSYSPPAPEKGKAKSSDAPSKQTDNSQPPKTTPIKPQSTSQEFTPSKASRKNQKFYRAVTKPQYTLNLNLGSSSQVPPVNAPDPPSTIQNQQTPSLPPASSLSLFDPCSFSSPDPIPRPSLKRSRSSPILSPPLSISANPFSALQLPEPPEPVTPIIPSPTLDPTTLKALTPFVSGGPPLPGDPLPEPSL
ncbi:DUF4283 domain-containing protein [Raphanus sativus]|nr:DUF4283 domain-containing protein [Raphanus sativus]